MIYFDGHLHTTHSDGVHDVGELFALLHKSGVKAAVLTDHDTTKGSDEFRERAAAAGVEAFTGVEMSVGFRGHERHILAYFAAPKRESPQWQAFTAALQLARTRRRSHLPRYLARLAELGMPLTEAEVLLHASEETVGRPHVARALLKRGYVTSMNDAFDRFLGNGKPAFIAREYSEASEMLRLAKEAGGLTSAAHPNVYRILRDELVALKALGLDAIEVHHPQHDPAALADYLRHANDLDLLITGGSDFHGGHSDEGAPQPGSCGLERKDFERFRVALDSGQRR